MATWTEQELQQTLSAVIHRASTDPGFRRLALHDPRAAIAAITPRPLPAGVEYKFVDNRGPTKYVIIPESVPGITERQLSESELETVAGGIDNPPPPPTTIVGG